MAKHYTIMQWVASWSHVHSGDVLDLKDGEAVASPQTWRNRMQGYGGAGNYASVAGLDPTSDPLASGPDIAPDHADAAVWLAGQPFKAMFQNTASPPLVPGSAPTKRVSFRVSPVKFPVAQGVDPELQGQLSERDRSATVASAEALRNSLSHESASESQGVMNE